MQGDAKKLKLEEQMAAELMPQASALPPPTYDSRAPLLGEMIMGYSNRILSEVNELHRLASQRVPGSEAEVTSLASLSQELAKVARSLHALSQPSKIARLSLPDSSLQLYDVLSPIGTGTFGTTKLCRYKPTGMYYCLKIMQKARVVKLKQQEHVKSELKVLSALQHPFVIGFHQSFQDEYNLYLVMDYVPGGELFGHIRAGVGGLPEDATRFYTAEIILALDYLHRRKIVHRDLKPENLLLDKRGHIKLVDFGFAKIVEDKTFTVCGTPEYIAPEVISGRGHSFAVDYWSLGILVFEMLSGRPPFRGSSNYKLFELILACQYQGKQIPMSFSPEASLLVRGLLQLDPTRRLGTMARGIRDLKEHPFFASTDWEQVLACTALGPLQALTLLPPLSKAGNDSAPPADAFAEFGMNSTLLPEM